MKLLKNKLAVIVIILSVAFLILIGYSASTNKGSFLENGVGYALNSIQESVYSLGSKVKDSVSFIASFSEVKTENETLKKQNEELQSKALDYDTLLNENNELRNMLNFTKEHEGYDYLGADIVGKSGDNWLNGFAINKGTSQGINRNMIVVTSQGLVGKITTANKSWSIVETLGNENISVNSLVQRTRENGEIKGYRDDQNNLRAKLYFLPLEADIQEGDIILTSGLGASYPKDIKIGYVTSIEEDKGKLMKNAIIKPYVDFNKLEEVFVVIPKGEIPASGDIKY